MPVLAPQQEARQQIDKMLEAAGWEVQSYHRTSRSAALGVAVCEFPLTTGWVDYMLFADGRPIGVVAEAESTDAGGSGRVRGVLQSGEPARADGNLVGGEPGWPVAGVRLRRADGAGQGLPGHLLAAGREPEETANLPEPDVLAAEIVENLEAALEQFRLIAEDLGE